MPSDPTRSESTHLLPGIRARAELVQRRANYHLHDRMLSNRSSRRAFRKVSSALAEPQQDAVGRLEADGIAVMHYDELVGNTVLWDEISADAARFRTEAELQLADSARPRKGKSYLIRRNPKRPKRMTPELAGKKKAPWRFDPANPWLRLGVSPSLLGVVNAYRGLLTKLTYFDQWYTIPVGMAADRVASQNWHRDPEDLHVVKVFVYLSDVDEEAGPFEYVPGSQPGGRYGDVWPWTFMRGSDYPSPAEFAKRISPDEYLAVTGKRGTIVLCDSSGFHRGGFARTRPRVMSVYTYVSPASLAVGTSWPEFDVRRAKRQSELTPEASFALHHAA